MQSGFLSLSISASSNLSFIAATQDEFMACEIENCCKKSDCCKKYKKKGKHCKKCPKL